MEDLNTHLKNLKSRYRYFFLKSAEDIQRKIQDLKPETVTCEIFDCCKVGTSGRIWQEKVYNFLKDRHAAVIKKETSKIKNLRKNCNCEGCGVCCKFAVSEFSPAELAAKSKHGDNYAKQFLSVFVPYENPNEVKKIFPEYLSLLKNQNESGYYFYHCPKVTKDNRCPDYENRPQICRDFPDNPIAFLPLSCGFNSWKLQSEDICLKLNAEVEIIEFYLDKLKVLLNL